MRRKNASVLERAVLNDSLRQSECERSSLFPSTIDHQRFPSKIGKRRRRVLHPLWSRFEFERECVQGRPADRAERENRSTTIAATLIGYSIRIRSRNDRNHLIDRSMFVHVTGRTNEMRTVKTRPKDVIDRSFLLCGLGQPYSSDKRQIFNLEISLLFVEENELENDIIRLTTMTRDERREKRERISPVQFKCLLIADDTNQRLRRERK